MTIDWNGVARQTGHRSYAPPTSPWLLKMSWCDLCFLHWEVDAEALQALLPPSLPLDLHEGRAYLAVVPFRMEHITGRFMPDVPGLSAFCELNVRTYVVRDGQPGVYFFSLDATPRLAVWGARTFFRLPYLRAEMACDDDGDALVYRSTRIDPRAPSGVFRARYGPTGPVAAAAPGSLEAFLTERYCLYTVDRAGEALRAHIQHEPWPLQPGFCDVEEDTVVPVPIARVGPPLVHFARRLNVVGWGLERAARGVSALPAATPGRAEAGALSTAAPRR